MKIEKSNASVPSLSVSESGARATPKAENISTAIPQGVSVSLGSTTSQLRSMESSMAGSPLVDAKKVAEIKQAISEGRFQINSGAIADKLVSNVRDLITASQR